MTRIMVDNKIKHAGFFIDAVRNVYSITDVPVGDAAFAIFILLHQ